MKIIPLSVITGPALLLSVLFSSAALAEDAPSGEKLVGSNCVACHDSSVYTRDDRRVSNRDGLEAQVSRCEANLGLQWFDDQRDAVVNYLNDSYYHF